MGHVFSYQDAINYERLLSDPANGFIVDLQQYLMAELLKPQKGQHILDVGCGTGVVLPFFLDKGLSVSGIDPSPYVLDIAKKNIGHSVDFHRGFGEDLPFDDNSYNTVTLVSVLEYVENPEKTIEEACRVAKDNVFVSVMNRYALKRVSTMVKGADADRIYRQARSFSIWELTRIIQDLSGDVPLKWKTASRLPEGSNLSIDRIKNAPESVAGYPFGAYIGMVVPLMPRYRTRPLKIAYSAEP